MVDLGVFFGDMILCLSNVCFSFVQLVLFYGFYHSKSLTQMVVYIFIFCNYTLINSEFLDLREIPADQDLLGLGRRSVASRHQAIFEGSIRVFF